MPHRNIRSLGIEHEGHAYHFGYDEGPPGEGQVQLQTLYSGFSAGTGAFSATRRGTASISWRG